MSVCHLGFWMSHSTARVTAIATIHTAARKMSSKISTTTAANQKIPSGRFGSKKRTDAPRLAENGERAGPTVPRLGSALGPPVIGSYTRCFLSAPRRLGQRIVLSTLHKIGRAHV